MSACAIGHTACVIVDAHTDVLLEVLVGPGENPSLELVLRHGPEGVFERYWLDRLEAADVGIQVCPLYGACAPGPGARERALAQEAELSRAVEAHADRVCLVRTAEQLEDPRLRIVLSMEGVEALEGDPAAFEESYERGVRSVGLTWNHANDFAGGVRTRAQGLTERGRALVRHLGELGCDPGPRPRVRADLARRTGGGRAVLRHARRLPGAVRSPAQPRPTGSWKPSRSVAAWSA